MARIPRLHVPVTKPEDVIPHLAKQERHWRAGYSAYELAMAWTTANDFPPTIRDLLHGVEEYAGAELVDAFLERQVELGDGRRPSQADLLAIVGLREGLAVIAVEGKVDEPFDKPVSEWNDGSPGKSFRLGSLCKTLGLEPVEIGSIYYQLLHRTASAIYEAKRYRCQHALMIVHSFSDHCRWFDEFAAFSRAMAMPLDNQGRLSPPKMCEGVELRLGWAADTKRADALSSKV